MYSLRGKKGLPFRCPNHTARLDPCRIAISQNGSQENANISFGLRKVVSNS
jgi:hypothetical protein